MATATEISTVRKYTNATAEEYPDGDINTAIDDNNGDLYLAAAEVWEWKASKFSELVDTSESGSSRKNAQLYENAIAQAARYKDKSDEQGGTDEFQRPTTRIIQRL